jgi:hypothetical protein
MLGRVKPGSPGRALRRRLLKNQSLRVKEGCLPQDADGVIVLSNISCVEFSLDNPVQRSLSAIRKAHSQLHSLQTGSVTSDALACQIALYDLILYEISDIRAGLARRFGTPQSSRREFQIQLRCLN